MDKLKEKLSNIGRVLFPFLATAALIWGCGWEGIKGLRTGRIVDVGRTHHGMVSPASDPVSYWFQVIFNLFVGVIALVVFVFLAVVLIQSRNDAPAETTEAESSPTSVQPETDAAPGRRHRKPRRRH